MRTCTKCGLTKPLDEFYKDASQRGGHRPDCRECVRKRTAERHYVSTYGMTEDELKLMLHDQGHACAVCGTPAGEEAQSGLNPGTHKRRNSLGLVVDHCHTNGHVRGLLCSSCNMALGSAKDDPKILRALAQYLEDDKI